jgi:hypothetical protein
VSDARRRVLFTLVVSATVGADVDQERAHMIGLAIASRTVDAASEVCEAVAVQVESELVDSI